VAHSYTEPTIIWRMRHPDGLHAHATLIPGVPSSTLTWFIDGEMVRAENFDEWDLALVRADEVKSAFRQSGWEPEE